MNQFTRDKKAVARASAILLLSLTAAVVAVTLITVLSRPKTPVTPGGDTLPPVHGSETDRENIRPKPGTPETQKPTPETKAPPVTSSVTPETEPLEPVIAPVTVTWTSPLAAPTLLKAHDLTAQVFSRTMNDYRVHRGVDLGTADGAVVYCAADGVISGVTDDPFMGRTVTVTHDGGYMSFYKNLAPVDVPGITVGARVSAGTKLGAVGESAIIEISDEPHLHFEITRDGEPVDPLEVVRITFSESAYEG